MDLLNVKYEKKPCYDIVFSSQFEELSIEVEKVVQQTNKCCIITDDNVEPLYLSKIMKLLSGIFSEVVFFVLPAGEENKTLANVELTYEFLIQNKFERTDKLVALGGGVIGDMTGYIAATYLRGIDFIQIPTTLLSQTDSSIGGKTGVDFKGYKNMVGAFKMPILVYINPLFLETLEERQYFSGFAEIMKHGLIKDATFYVWLIENMYEICERKLDVVLEMIRRSCEIKKAVVEKDPTEKGERALLNFGHTIGHAIEKSMNFTLYHGECVALGCVAAAFISWKKEYLTMDEYYEIRDMFVPFNLPISMENLEPEEILQFTKLDKKMYGGTIKFILLKKVGKAFIDTTVTEEEMLAGINEIYFTEEDYDA